MEEFCPVCFEKEEHPNIPENVIFWVEFHNFRNSLEPHERPFLDYLMDLNFPQLKLYQHPWFLTERI